MTEVYDILIIGAGPAGLTAAIYTTRRALKTLVVGKVFGGQQSEASKYENYPGFPEPLSGMELSGRMVKQAEHLGAKVIYGEVLRVKESKGFKKIELVSGEKFKAKALILATGGEHRKLGVPGEEELKGKGISYCATCDGPFFKGKTVVVIGGANSAVGAAVYLSDIAKKVYISYRHDKFRAEEVWIKRLKEKKNIESLFNTVPKEIKGKDKVEAIVLEDANTKKIREIKTDGVMIEIGIASSVNLATQIGVKLENNYIKVTPKQETNIPGVFSAGDVTTNSAGLRQSITAAAEGAIAATYAYIYVKQKEVKKK